MIDLSAEINNEQAKKALDDLRKRAKQCVSATITEFDRLDFAVLRFSSNMNRMGKNFNLGSLEVKLKYAQRIFGELGKIAIPEVSNEKAASEARKLTEAINSLNAELERTQQIGGLGLMAIVDAAREARQEVESVLSSIGKAYPNIATSTSGAEKSSNNAAQTKEETEAVRDQVIAYEELLDVLKVSAVSREQVAEQIKKIDASYQQHLKTIKDINRIEGKLGEGERLTSGQTQAREEAKNAIEAERSALRMYKNELREQDRILNAASGSIDQMTAALNRLRTEYSSLSEDDRLGERGKEIDAYMDALQQKIAGVEGAMKTQIGTMGSYGNGFNALQFQIQQVARELPALAYGPQIFFSALSNNLPMLADEIARTKKELGGMRPVLKQIIGSVVSWQTLLIAGVTVFTMYGKEIGAWVGSLFKGRKALDEMAAAQKVFNDTMTRGAIDAQSEAVKFQLLYKTATDSAVAMEQRTKAVDEIRKLYPSYLEGLSNEEIMLGKASDAYEKITTSIYQAAKARAAFSKLVELGEVEIAAQAPDYRARAEEAKRRQEMAKADRQNVMGVSSEQVKAYNTMIRQQERAERNAFKDWVKTQGDKFEWIKEQGIKTFDELDAYISRTSKALEPTAALGITGDNKAEEYRKAQEDAKRLAEARKQAEEKTIEVLKELGEEATQNAIDMMADGLAKEIAQINRNYDKKIEAVRNREAELRAANGGRLPNGAQPRIDALIKSYNAQRAVEVAKATERAEAEAEEARKKELSAMYDYIQQYGTLLERKSAIAEEYGQKIADASNEWDKKRYAAERDALIQEIDDQILKDSINWEEIFGDIANKSLEGLKAMRDEIRKLLSSDLKFSPTDVSKLYEQYNKIGEAIDDASYSFAKFIGFNDDGREKAKRLREEYEELKRIFDELQQQQDEAEFKQFETQEALKDFVFQNTGKQVSGNESYDSLKSLFSGADSNTQSQFNSLFQNNTQASQQLTDITSKVGQAGDAMGKAGDALKNVGGGAAGTIGMIDKIIHGINDNIQSMVQLVEELGVKESDFGRFVGEFAKSSQYATNGWESLKKGDAVGVVANVLGSLRTLGNSLGELGIKGFGASNPDLYRDIERLTAVNEELKNAISSLTEVIEDVPILEAVDEYAKQVQWLNDAIANTQKMMLDSLNAYSNGFLGIGGKHSSRKAVDEGVSFREWQRISGIVDKSINSAADFFSLSSSEMLEVLRSAPDLYAKIKDLANNGYADAGKFMDEYVEFAKQREELELAYRETLTDISFDSLRDEFKSVLLDMELDASDFAKTFNKQLANSIAEALMKEKYDRQIKELFGQWGEYMESGGTLSDDEIKRLQEAKNLIYEQMAADREGLRFLIDEKLLSGQSATSKGFQTMDQEIGSELNGRFTDMQGKMTEIRDYIATMLQNQQEGVNMTTDIRDIAIQISQSVADIRLYTEVLPQIQEDISSMSRTIKDRL